ncbi:hypothetical protein [Paraburkholderia sp. MM6662-R1]|uniref:hypothetical protein n=1 Tax=Paraburkholderia sp. MM6662-R1 TaxID=2991066 RepID=UPI003D24FBFF
MTEPAISDLQVARRACAMLNDLADVLRARLLTEADPEERKFLEHCARQIPNVSMLLGMAMAAQDPNAAIRRGL